jgi:hypothetical protein
MLHYAFLSILLSVSIVDILVYRGVSVAPMALLYVVLKLQADRAADKFLSAPATAPEPQQEPSWMPPPEQDPFAPLPLGFTAQEKTEPKEKEKTRATESKKAAPSRPREKPRVDVHASPFRAPRFHGSPHEVLGIETNANTSVIVQAFRHWIKRYHPDHLRAIQRTQSATEKARTLTAAKDTLLERRKHSRKAA